MQDFKPATWIMLIVLMALIFVPAFFLAKPPEPEPFPDTDLTTPPDIPNSGNTPPNQVPHEVPGQPPPPANNQPADKGGAFE